MNNKVCRTFAIGIFATKMWYGYANGVVVDYVYVKITCVWQITALVPNVAL